MNSNADIRSDRFRWSAGQIVVTEEKAKPKPQQAVEATLHKKLRSIIKDERERLNGVWDDMKPKLMSVLGKAKKAKDNDETDEFADDLAEYLDSLSDSLVSAEAIRQAVRDGFQAGRSDADIDGIANIWIGHLQKYADLVPERIAEGLAGAVGDASSQDGATADDIAAALDAKIEAFRHSVARYSEPAWGAGMEAYGDALDSNDILLVWTLGDDVDHCDVCPDLADGSPYAKGDLPTWPKAGDTPCFDNCYCTITADPATWAQAFPQTNYSEEEEAA